jgi:hypothetical protein
MNLNPVNEAATSRFNFKINFINGDNLYASYYKN